MIKKILPIAVLAIMMANCTEYNLPLEDLSNKEQMNLLVIPDPLVWNSLATQAMEIDTTDNGMKASNGMDKMKEYPDKGYYFALFEDLFPSQGDYDFNDVILQTKISLDAKKKEVWGTVNTTVFHRGGSLSTKLGLIFYSVEGNKDYTRIDNDKILIGGKRLTGTDPYTIDLPAEGDEISLDYFIEDPTSNINQLWISWHIIVSYDDEIEIHSSGFPASKNRKFEIPQRDFLTANNLPWGLEIEAEEFFVPKERTLFLKAYPEFQEWAETAGVKNKDWYENPDMDYIQ